MLSHCFPHKSYSTPNSQGSFLTPLILRKKILLVLSSVKVTQLSRLFETPWSAANQAPLSMELSGQEYCSGLPFPSPGDLPDLGIKHRSLVLQASILPSEPPGKSQFSIHPKFLPSSLPTTPSQPWPPKSVREYEPPL